MHINDGKTEFIENMASFYNHICKNSLIKFDAPIPGKKDVLSNLYDDIECNTYQPNLPREYIIYNKGNHVARIVPTFELKDYCTYFYCTNKLQDYICDGASRIPGTFGGWRIKSPIKQVEQIEEEYLLDFSMYSPYATLSIEGWSKEWGEFSRMSLGTFERYKGQYGDDFSVAIFDIANFYDNIRINLLERFLRQSVPNTFSPEIDLLIYFLQYWNKPFDGYYPRTAGIPQDEVGDCSRQLANFYLKDFDKKLYTLTQKDNSQYLRYADDITIFNKDKILVEHTIFESSKTLHKLGLNINAGKVRIMSSSEYSIYEAFDILYKLQKYDKKVFNSGVKDFVTYKDRKYTFRYDRVIKRIITILAKKGIQYLDADLQDIILNEILTTTVLSVFPTYKFKNIYNLMKQVGREKDFMNALDALIHITSHNSFHYSLLKFYKSINRTDFDYDNLQSEIDSRKLRLGFY